MLLNKFHNDLRNDFESFIFRDPFFFASFFLTGWSISGGSAAIPAVAVAPRRFTTVTGGLELGLYIILSMISSFWWVKIWIDRHPLKNGWLRHETLHVKCYFLIIKIFHWWLDVIIVVGLVENEFFGEEAIAVIDIQVGIIIVRLNNKWFLRIGILILCLLWDFWLFWNNWCNHFILRQLLNTHVLLLEIPIILRHRHSWIDPKRNLPHRTWRRNLDSCILISFSWNAICCKKRLHLWFTLRIKVSHF